MATLPVIQPPSGASSRGSHQLATTFQCDRKWVLRYRKRIEPTAEPEFRMGGTLIHDAVAHRYAERMIERELGTPSWWTGDSVDEVLSKAGSGYPHLAQTAREVYDAYPAYWWDLAQEKWDPIAVEEEFRATVGELDPGGQDKTLDDEVVTCRSDLVVRDPDSGCLWVVDHKTKSGEWRNNGRLPAWNPDGEYAVSWQACINLLILRQRYPNDTVRGFIVNRITRRPPFDFDRHVLTISPRVYANVPRVIRDCVARERMIDGMLTAGETPMPAYWECYGRFGTCDYRKLCNAASVDEMNVLYEAHYRSRD